MIRILRSLLSALTGDSAPGSPPPRDAGHTAAPDALTPDELRLAEEAGVAPDAALALRRQGRDLERLTGFSTESFDEVPAPGVTTGVPEDRVLPAIRALREQVGPGYAVFRCTRGWGHEDDRVAVMRADDPFAPLEAMGTNGANFDLYTAEVLAKVREWDARFGLRITGAYMDSLEAEFVRQPDDMLAFAREVYAFCPDVVDQGTGDVEALAEEMRRFNTVYLWWD